MLKYKAHGRTDYGTHQEVGNPHFSVCRRLYEYTVPHKCVNFSNGLVDQIPEIRFTHFVRRAVERPQVG